jgi:hypothetical protein
MQSLTEDDLERIADQVKEATDESFEHATQQQEERNSDMQAQISTLRQILETTRLAPVHTREQVHKEQTTCR